MELKLHVFEPSKKSDTPTAAVIFFFGGGWAGGSPLQFYHQCRYFSGQGVLAIAPEYRTRSNGGVDPPECVKDGKAAVRYVRKHAKELNIDPNRIAVGGGSAGGHIAAATGTLTKFEHKDEDLSVSCRPNVMLLYNPVYDNSEKGYGYNKVKEYWRDISPLHNIDKNIPPAIVFFGSNDKHLKVSNAEMFQKKMQDLGVRSELLVYEKQRHGFFNSSKKTGANKWFLEVLAETHEFLAEYGYLTGEPKVEEYASLNNL
ncbi:MAG: alpha/beta hydrolase [Planctomycetota bacterium]